MSAFDKLLGTPAQTATKKTGSAFDRILAPKTAQETAKDQHAADVARANSQWNGIQGKLETKPTTMDTVKSLLGMFSPSNIKSTVQNTSVGSPLQTAASVGSGLLDIGPRIANSIGVKNLIGAAAIPGLSQLFTPLTNRLPNIQLPLPGKTAMEYSGNSSDLSHALSEATTQVGGFELGGAVTRGLGLPKFAAGVLGNVLGGQATTEATAPIDRLKQAGFDAAFGLATEGLGAGIRKLKPKVESPTIEPPKPDIKVVEPAPKPSLTQKMPQGEPITSKPTKSPVKPETTTPVESQPIPKKASKVGRSIEANAIKDDLVKSFNDTAQYDPKTVADQADRVSKLITEDLTKARRIVEGAEKVPEGMSPAMFIKGIEAHARSTGDVQLLRDTARSSLSSDTSLHAQEMRFLRERNPDSPVKAIQDLQAAREKALETKGIDLKKAKTSIKSQIKNEMKKAAPKPKDWSSFIESIKCK